MKEPKPISPGDFAEMMRFIIASSDDAEESHMRADSALCTLLRDLGYGEAVDVFENSKRWYA